MSLVRLELHDRGGPIRPDRDRVRLEPRGEALDGGDEPAGDAAGIAAGEGEQRLVIVAAGRERERRRSR